MYTLTKSETGNFRKVDLENTYTANLLLDCLNEKVSSWTYGVENVKAFKHGVTPKGKGQSVILCLLPSPTQVILNLARLYDDQGFLLAVKAHRRKIKNYERGIGLYWNTQDEVILKVEQVSTHNVYSLGGYSSTPEHLMWQGAVMSGLPLPIVYQYLASLGDTHWLSPEGTQAVLSRMYPHTFKYRNVMSGRAS